MIEDPSKRLRESTTLQYRRAIDQRQKMYQWRAALPRSRVTITIMIEDPGKWLRGSTTLQYRGASDQRQKM